MPKVEITEFHQIIRELRPEYFEVCKALYQLEKKGLFPLNSSGEIVLRYDEKGKLRRAVAPYVVKT